MSSVLGASFSILGASFSSFGCFVFDLECFVFEFWVLRASVFVFECFVFETTQQKPGYLEVREMSVFMSFDYAVSISFRTIN